MSTATDPVVHPLTRLHTLWNDPDYVYWDGQNRERVDETHEDWLIDNLIPIGCSVIYADPGAGKSYIMLSVIHHLVYGTPLGPWGSSGPGRALCLVYDLEGTWSLTQDRGYAVTPYGSVPADGDTTRQDNFCLWASDVIAPTEREAWRIIGNQAKRHTQYLEQVLTDAENAGAPIRLVVIDTFSKFCGPKPQKAAGNAYEYEADIMDGLNRIALRHRCAIVIIHHTNKQGEISGSQGIGGSAIVTAKLDVEEQSDEDRDAGVRRKAVLRSTKVRIGQPYVYALEQSPDGPWEFVEKPPNESMARGLRLKVLEALNRGGPATYGELVTRTQLGGALKTTLTRMRQAGDIFTKYGKWHVRRPDVAQRTLPGQADGQCGVCLGPMTVVVSQGITWDRHPGCEPDPEPEVSRETEPEPEPWEADDVSRETEQTRTDALDLLKTSIRASRMHPVMFIPAEHRPAAPWSLINERMDGAHAWINPVAHLINPAQLVAVLDRVGSFPSAMSSVTVAANLLTHTGPLDTRDLPTGKLAGIFRIIPPEWDERKHGIGHPLGRVLDRLLPDGSVWVATPHIETLEKLARPDGDRPALIFPVDLLDSWAGRGTGGLFTAFSRQIRKLRAELADGEHADELIELKRRSSSAIRMLWPKGARSPFCRPDHSVSIRCESSQRLWWRGFQVAQGGAESVLRLGMTDEIVVTVSDPVLVPAPLKLGVSFGEVHHKEVKVGDEKQLSPVAAGYWRQSVRSLRSV